jgi:hypothetical protein
MGGGKLTRMVGSLFLVFGVSLMCGFWWARTTGHGDLGLFFGKGLLYLMYGMIVCVGYMAIVGAYHTFLAIFGLDGEPGLFSSGKRTEGPLSSPDEASKPPAGDERPPATLH